METTELIHCSKCGEDKPRMAFASRSEQSGKPQAWCRSCMAADFHQWYENNRTGLLQRRREQRAARREV